MSRLQQRTVQVGGQAAAAMQRLRVSLDPFRLSLFLLMIINVSRIHQHFKAIAVLRPAVILVALTAMWAVMEPRLIRYDNLRQGWMPKVVAAIAVLACVGAPFGISLGGTGKFMIDEYSKTLIFAVLVLIAIRNTTDLFTLVWAYVISSGILVWMSLFLFGLSKGGGAAARLSHLYSFDANDVGLVLLVGLAFAILTLQTSSKRGLITSGIIIAGIGAALARTGSRGAFLGLIVVGTILLFALHQVAVVKRVGFVLVTVVALVVAAPEGYWEQMHTLTKPTEDYNWQTKDGRVEVWKRGLGYMLSYPIFGLGLDNFARAECQISPKLDTHIAGTGLRCTPPHSSFVQAGAELGLPGLILWSSLVFGGIYSMYRLRKRLPRAWAHGDAEQRFLYLATLYFMLAMIGFAVTCAFLTFAWLDIVYIIGAFMTGLHVCVWQKLRSGATGAPAQPGPRVPGRRGPAVIPPAPRGRGRGRGLQPSGAPSFIPVPPPPTA
ncbi:MAG TPA: O-antigen ligase family protein [Gemmatimonadales bacterium]|nr:O-antigen ligase family protein [Gemmatimonadales bacterium]